MVIDNFSKFAWTIPLKNKYAQTIKDELSNIITESRRKPYLIETDDGNEFVNRHFNEFLEKDNSKR